MSHNPGIATVLITTPPVPRAPPRSASECLVTLLSLCI
jgi:hypothetical protein